MKKEIIFDYDYFDNLESAPAHYQMIINEAKKAQEKAYAPYSEFRVGSALELENGKIILYYGKKSLYFALDNLLLED